MLWILLPARFDICIFPVIWKSPLITTTCQRWKIVSGLAIMSTSSFSTPRCIPSGPTEQPLYSLLLWSPTLSSIVVNISLTVPLGSGNPRGLWAYLASKNWHKNGTEHLGFCHAILKYVLYLVKACAHILLHLSFVAKVIVDTLLGVVHILCQFQLQLSSGLWTPSPHAWAILLYCLGSSFLLPSSKPSLWCLSSGKHCPFGQALLLPCLLRFQLTGETGFVLQAWSPPTAISWGIQPGRFPEQAQFYPPEAQIPYSAICLPYFSWDLNS